MTHEYFVPFITPGRRQSKTPIISRNVDQKSIETMFSIAICRPTGDKWQLKTLFLSIFDPHLLIVDYVFDRRLPGVFMLQPPLQLMTNFAIPILIFSRKRGLTFHVYCLLQQTILTRKVKPTPTNKVNKLTRSSPEFIKLFHAQLN